MQFLSLNNHQAFRAVNPLYFLPLESEVYSVNLYQKNAIAYLKAQIKVAREAREENDFARFHTICNMIRSEISYCTTIGLFGIEKEKLLLKIADKMIYSNDSRS